MLMVDGCPVDLSVDETRAVLEAVPNRLVEYSTASVGGTRVGHEVEIFYNGAWMILGRTDLKDNICTSHPFRASMEYYKSLIRYGARVTKNGFFVIDSWSDG